MVNRLFFSKEKKNAVTTLERFKNTDAILTIYVLMYVNYIYSQVHFN